MCLFNLKLLYRVECCFCLINGDVKKCKLRFCFKILVEIYNVYDVKCLFCRI